MKHKLVLKSIALASIACSINAIVGAAANVAPQVSDTAKHDAVQSNWMDRTDIAVGVQSGGRSKLDKGHFLTDDLDTIYDKQSDYGNLTKAYIEMICTHFPGHILFTSLNTWMLPCILQGASILFFSESFYYCNS